MKWLIPAITAATLITSSAYAQSFDPDVGSGNLDPRVVYKGDAPVQVLPGRRAPATAPAHVAQPAWQYGYASAGPAASAQDNWFAQAEGNIE